METQNSISQVIRYGIIGSFAAVTQYFTVIVLVEAFQLHPLEANVIGFLGGFLVSYLGQRFWTFATTTQHAKKTLPLYFLVATANLILNQSLYYWFLNQFHIPYHIALIAVIFICAVFSFMLSKFWVFRS